MSKGGKVIDEAKIEQAKKTVKKETEKKKVTKKIGNTNGNKKSRWIIQKRPR